MARRSRSGRSRVVQPFGSERSTENRSIRSAQIQQANEPRPKAKEDLKCAICLEYLRDPKLLPCLHSYCNRCLLGVKPNGNQIKCPKCRSCHQIPNGGVEEFPSDQVLVNSLQMIEFQSNDDKKKAIPCNMCTEDDPATAHCSTCGNFLCDFCLKSHKRQVNYRSHKIISLDELDKESIRSLDRPNHCDTHVGEVLKLYCTTCDQLICRDCTIVDHRSHEYGFTSDQRPVVEKNVLKAVKVLTKKEKKFKKLLTFIEALGRSRDTHSTSLEGEINKAFDTYVKRLELHRKNLLEDIKCARDSDMKQIWAQQEFIETTIAGLSSALRYTEQMSSCPSDSAMLAMNSKVTPQLKKLEAITWDLSTIELAEPLSYVSTPLEVESAIALQSMNAGMQKPIVNVVSNAGYQVYLEQTVAFSVYATVGRYQLPLGKPSITILSSDPRSVTDYTLSGIAVSGPRSVTDFNLSDAGGGVWTVQFSPPFAGVFTVNATFDDNPYLITALCASQLQADTIVPDHQQSTAATVDCNWLQEDTIVSDYQETAAATVKRVWPVDYEEGYDEEGFDYRHTHEITSQPVIHQQQERVYRHPMTSPLQPSKGAQCQQQKIFSYRPFILRGSYSITICDSMF